MNLLMICYITLSLIPVSTFSVTMSFDLVNICLISALIDAVK